MNVLAKAFQSGYANASASFGLLNKDTVVFQDSHLGCYKAAANDQFDLPACSGPVTLLTTEIFGDLSGKSYLLISDPDLDFLTQKIPEGTDPNINFKEEFIKEVDNILSASVITELSNELSIKAYGDIPVLIGRIEGGVEQLIYSDFHQCAGDVFVTAATFSFSSKPSARPLFIWVLNANFFEDN